MGTLSIRSYVSKVNFLCKKHVYLKPLIRRINIGIIKERIYTFNCFPLNNTTFMGVGDRIYSEFLTSKFHVSAILFVKHFKENENEASHEVIEEISSYKTSIVKHPSSVLRETCDVSVENLLESELLGKSPVELVNIFRMVSSKNKSQPLDLEDVKYKNLISAVCKTFSEISVEHLISVLSSLCLWPPTPSSSSPHFKTIWNNLDTECSNRSKSLTPDVQLLIADYWFHLKLSRISLYNTTMINNLFKDIRNLNTAQIVQLSFFINLQRNVLASQMIQLEEKLKEVICKLNTNELGIVCLGFFKTKTSIKNPLLFSLILDNALLNLHEISSVILSAFVKQFRLNFSKQTASGNYFTSGHLEKCRTFIQGCVPYITNWEPTATVQIALLSVQIQFYHPELIDAVINHVLQHMGSVRLKVITKLLFCVTTFNHLPEKKNYFDIVIAQLGSARTEEISLYPFCLSSSVLYFAYNGIYPADLISNVLEPSFFHKLGSSSLKYTKDLAVLDYSVEVESPEYKGPRLDPKIRAELLMKIKGRIPDKQSANLTHREKILLSVRDALCDYFGGPQYVYVRHILPHIHSPDVILHLSSSGLAIPISDAVRNFPIDKILCPPKGERWFCILVCTKNDYVRETSHLSGLSLMKKRQLQKLGYKVIEVPWFHSLQHSEKKQQQQYFHNLLFSS